MLLNVLLKETDCGTGALDIFSSPQYLKYILM